MTTVANIRKLKQHLNVTIDHITEFNKNPEFQSFFIKNQK
jgi:hypothetical protein